MATKSPKVGCSCGCKFRVKGGDPSIGFYCQCPDCGKRMKVGNPPRPQSRPAAPMPMPTLPPPGYSLPLPPVAPSSTLQRPTGRKTKRKKQKRRRHPKNEWSADSPVMFWITLAVLQITVLVTALFVLPSTLKLIKAPDKDNLEFVQGVPNIGYENTAGASIDDPMVIEFTIDGYDFQAERADLKDDTLIAIMDTKSNGKSIRIGFHFDWTKDQGQFQRIWQIENHDRVLNSYESLVKLNRDEGYLQLTLMIATFLLMPIVVFLVFKFK